MAGRGRIENNVVIGYGRLRVAQEKGKLVERSNLHRARS
jgi:hypothetical protein